MFTSLHTKTTPAPKSVSKIPGARFLNNEDTHCFHPLIPGKHILSDTYTCTNMTVLADASEIWVDKRVSSLPKYLPNLQAICAGEDEHVCG
eukprot:g50420.t1